MIRRRMTVKRVDPWSVLKLGLFLNLAGGAIILLTGVVVWSVVRRLQMVERGCEQIQNIFGLQECAVAGTTVFRGGFLMVALWVVVMTAVLVFSAFLYNLVADLTGGVEFSAVDHTPPMVARGTSTGGGVQVAPELQQTSATPAVVGPSGRRVEDATIPADAVDRRTREPSRFKKAAQVASTKLTEASRTASTTLTEATKTEATTRARKSQANTQSLDSIWLDRPVKKSGNGSSGEGAGPPDSRSTSPQRGDEPTSSGSSSRADSSSNESSGTASKKSGTPPRRAARPGGTSKRS